jgi:Ca2+-binding EF-hand superfamily protein
MDTDSDKEIQIDEFRSKTRMLKIDLTDDESKALFVHIDKNSGGTISYKEFVQTFSQINTTQMIRNIDKIIKNSKSSAEAIFDMYSSDKTKKTLRKADFIKLVKYFFNKIAEYEISHLYEHFDSNKSGFVSKMEFKKAF